jgi:YVTN family beta-propeller protein
MLANLLLIPIGDKGSFVLTTAEQGGEASKRASRDREAAACLASVDLPGLLAVTADGRYAVISAGPRVTSLPFGPSGMVYVIDLRSRNVVATVTGVGNDPYGLAIVEADDD